jgi:MHS family proline/betaine transporter-like MFS transporter
MTALVPREARRAVAAAVVGNVLEWYDLAVYAYMATVIAKKFFPAGDDVTSLLSTFAAFGLGFVARPLGGMVIGRLGDLKGRKTALLVTIVLMAGGTVAIGLVPTFETIGIVAPTLVVLARLVQGFSAGGEWGGSTAFIVEWAPPGRRGLYGSLQQCSVATGLLLGSGVAALVNTWLSAEAADTWGWRIPFLLGGLLGPVGLYMRKRIAETPAFVRSTTAADPPRQPPAAPGLLAARAFGFTVFWTVSYYIVLTYMPTFLQKQVGVARSQALWATTSGLLVMVIVTPLMGLLSDRVGRRPLLAAACVASLVLAYPCFKLMLSGVPLSTIFLIQVALAFVIAVFSGPGPAAIAEIFPTRVRSTWMSTGYSFAVAIFGGFAPFIATWLIARTGDPLAPSYYLMAAAAITLVVVLRLEETARAPLR